jgi:pimeloyl-ACP methyl ester carboxylesterase/ketosteroid isomerase-like protein
MTTFILVHGAWHGDWAWDRVVPFLERAGAQVVAPSLTLERDVGLTTHVDEVLAVLDAVPTDGQTLLVGHSYAGLVVRQVADARPDSVDELILVEGWAGPDGASMLSLAPDWFVEGIRTAARANGGRRIPAPNSAVFGIDDPETAAWLQERLRPQPLRTFTEPTRLTGAVDAVRGTGVYCRPQNFPFAQFADDLGYPLVALDGPHDVMLARPEAVARELLSAADRGAAFDDRRRRPMNASRGDAPAHDRAEGQPVTGDWRDTTRTMSQETVEIVRRWNAAVSGGDYDAFSQLLHPDVEFFDHLPLPGGAEAVRGADAVCGVLAQWREAFAEFHAEVEEYIELDNFVVCATRWSFVSRDPEIALQWRGAEAHELRDGKVVWSEVAFRDRAAALEAVERRKQHTSTRRT